MSKSKFKAPKLKGIKQIERPSFEPVTLTSATGIDWKWFEEYYKKNYHKVKEDWWINCLLQAAEDDASNQGRKLSEAERSEIVGKETRRLARKSYPNWLRSQRIKVEKEWTDRLMERGAPDMDEIVGLANIAKALGYRANYLKHDQKIKKKLEALGIIYQGPDNKWRALKRVCDAFREGRKKNKTFFRLNTP